MKKDLNRPLILVVNDDSFRAAGVHRLIERLVKYADVAAICPAEPQSGQSMAITVNAPLQVRELPDYNGAKLFSVNGTPVDCVKLAMHHILKRRPDMVVSGINHGSNAAINVLYSGTMGAAMEGCAFGLPSVGFSLTDHDPDADFSPCYPAIDLLVPAILKYGLPQGVCLNVNIPNIGSIPKQIRLCTPCRGRWNDEYKEYTDPHGHKFYWLTGKYENEEPDNESTDEWALSHGFISVVPVAIDRTVDITPPLGWLPDVLVSYTGE